MNSQEVQHISQRADDESARDCQSHAALASGKETGACGDAAFSAGCESIIRIDV